MSDQNTPRSDWSTRRATLMRSLLEHSHNNPVRMKAEEVPEAFAGPDALTAWERENREHALLSAIADALVEAGVATIGQADYESLPGALAWLVANGFRHGAYFETDWYVLPNGLEDRQEQRERNAAVLRILNDPADPRHEKLVEFLAEIGVRTEPSA